MKERKPYLYIMLWKLVIELGPGDWMLALGYAGSRHWSDRYFYLVVGILYIRLWLTGETR